MSSVKSGYIARAICGAGRRRFAPSGVRLLDGAPEENDAGHIAVDYHHKSALNFNDDAVNTRVQVTLGMEF
jgi:hypothetical protein